MKLNGLYCFKNLKGFQERATEFVSVSQQVTNELLDNDAN